MASPETEATIFHRKRKLFLGGVVCVTILTSAIVSAVFISRDNNNNNVTTTAAPTPSIQSTIFPVATDDIEDEDDSSIISTAPTFMPTIAKISPEPDVTLMGTFELLETVPHDPDAFTQGLVMVAKDNNQHELYEGTGLYGESDVRRVNWITGDVLLQTELSDSYFGEGITYYQTESGEGRIVQLTWQEGLAFLYDSQTLQPISNVTFSTTRNEGWGITGRAKDGNKMFVVSDGSSYLHFWNQSNFVEFRRVQVTSRESLDNVPNSVNNLNELEWDPTTDTILANVWYSDTIQRIHPDTGLVIAQYDLSSLYPNRDLNSDVLNGIALVPGTSDEYWVTGKLWPNMFRIRLIDEPS